jgi:hypothetical protein
VLFDGEDALPLAARRGAWVDVCKVRVLEPSTQPILQICFVNYPPGPSALVGPRAGTSGDRDGCIGAGGG